MRRKMVVLASLIGILLAAWFLWPWGHHIAYLVPVAQEQALLISDAKQSDLHGRIRPDRRQTWLALVNRDGQALWRRLMDAEWSLETFAMGGPLDQRTYAADAERLYLQGHQKDRSLVQALSRADGETLWQHTLPSSTRGGGGATMYVAGPRLYILQRQPERPGADAHSYTLSALATQDGAQLWQQTLSLRMLNGLRTLSDQLLMVYSHDERLFFDGETGQALPDTGRSMPDVVWRSLGWVGCTGGRQAVLWRAEGLQLSDTPLSAPGAGCSLSGYISEYKGLLIYKDWWSQEDSPRLIASEPKTQQTLWHIDLGPSRAIWLGQKNWHQPFTRWTPFLLSRRGSKEAWFEEVLMLDMDRGEVVRRYATEQAYRFDRRVGAERSYLLRDSAGQMELVAIDPQSGAAQPPLVFMGVYPFSREIPEYTQDLWWFFDRELPKDRAWVPFEALRWGVFDLKRGEPAHLNGGYAPQQSAQSPDWLKEIPGGL